MKIRDITPALLRELLHYDPATGVLRWKTRSIRHFRDDKAHTASARMAQWNGKFAGKAALIKVNQRGYLAGAVLGVCLLAHRVAFAVHHGRWPDNIDHANGERADNRIENLSDVDRSGNHRNRRLPRSNKSGTMGVAQRSSGRWVATIRANGKQRYLGSFSTRVAAAAARSAAEIEHNYHSNHGRRA